MEHHTLEEAHAIIAALPRPALEEERLDLERQDAGGRILARAVSALHDQPPFDRSPLDGFALHSADSRVASADSPLTLPIERTVYAGDPPGPPLARGRAARIMTGAPLPPGADCVIRQEEVGFDHALLTLPRTLAAGENRVPRGEDYREGEVLLASGRRLDAAAVGVAAGAGHRELFCRRPLRAAVLSTGSELATPGNPLTPGQIHDGNRFYLRTRLRELGLQVPRAAALADDAGAIARWIDRALAGDGSQPEEPGCDLLVTTGGVSVGLHDLLPEALARLGARSLFHGLALKPGSPALLALYRDRPLLCLSGNPFAAAATLALLGMPLLARLTGCEDFLPRRAPGVLEGAFPKASGTRRFVRAHWEAGRVRLPAGHSSGQLRSLLGCNCLLDIPAGSGPLSPGDKVEVLLTWEGGR